MTHGNNPIIHQSLVSSNAQVQLRAVGPICALTTAIRRSAKALNRNCFHRSRARQLQRTLGRPARRISAFRNSNHDSLSRTDVSVGPNKRHRDCSEAQNRAADNDGSRLECVCLGNLDVFHLRERHDNWCWRHAA